MRSSVPLSSFLVSAIVLWSQASASNHPYDNCGVNEYYATLPSGMALWNRTAIGDLLKSTHRNELRYTSNTKEDVWDALIDLDPGSTPGTVRLIYRNVDVPAIPYGSGSTWNREHIWPKSHGVETTGPDMTDIHHLRPSDWNVNSARGNKYFSACGITRPLSECTSPAHAEADPTTERDPETWLPPQNVRGDIARALFYMDLRYFGVGEKEEDLTLTDCPGQNPNEMGYLSQLLEWHAQDPVDQAERDRNDRACSRWQGNRNIFVDYPELVSQLYGSPQEANGPNGYSQCTFTPPPPAAAAAASNCDDLSAGDVQLIRVQADNPDTIAMVALEALPAGVAILVTDKAWTGSDFRGYEGIERYTVPTGGIVQGSVFGFGSNALFGNADWQQESGTLSLSATGDNVFVYCMKESDGTPNFLSGLSYTGEWKAPGSSLSSGTSALPHDLSSVGSVALDHMDNYHYVGPTTGTKAALLIHLGDANYWSGSNSISGSVIQTSFTVEPGRRRNLAEEVSSRGLRGSTR
ncbi:MAG: hypothetical protein SGILL_001782 [Bacillariaceae sp.]